MDYEKKYNEALNWMRELYPGLHGATKEDAEHYFPELRESEDEIHRKWILEYIYDGLQKADEQFKDHFKSAIDWLEKQKEQKPVDDEAKAIAYREYERGRERGLRDGQKYVLDNAESYGLCKPAEWSEELDIDTLREWSMRYAPDIRQAIESTAYHFYNLRPHWKPSEQTHGWRHYIWAVNLRFDYDGLVKYEDTGSYEIVTAGDKPKRQVSGEYILLKDISSAKWKPSEHQMNILKAVKEYVGRGSGYWGEGLGSLIEDLEKLM